MKSVKAVASKLSFSTLFRATRSPRASSSHEYLIDHHDWLSWDARWFLNPGIIEDSISGCLNHSKLKVFCHLWMMSMSQNQKTLRAWKRTKEATGITYSTDHGSGSALRLVCAITPRHIPWNWAIFHQISHVSLSCSSSNILDFVVGTNLILIVRLTFWRTLQPRLLTRITLVSSTCSPHLYPAYFHHEFLPFDVIPRSKYDSTFQNLWRSHTETMKATCMTWN